MAGPELSKDLESLVARDELPPLQVPLFLLL